MTVRIRLCCRINNYFSFFPSQLAYPQNSILIGSLQCSHNTIHEHNESQNFSLAHHIGYSNFCSRCECANYFFRCSKHTQEYANWSRYNCGNCIWSRNRRFDQTQCYGLSCQVILVSYNWSDPMVRIRYYYNILFPSAWYKRGALSIPG